MISNYLNENNIDYRRDVLIQEITNLSEGGKCKYFCKPVSLFQFRNLLSFCLKQRIDFEVVGALTNTYFMKRYEPSVIITTIKVKEVKVEENKIICSTGYNLSKLSRDCSLNGIAGFEGFIGIPGTVGAAAINNAGAFNSEMAKVVKEVCILDKDNKLINLSNEDMGFVQRSSNLKKGVIKGYVLSVSFDISNKDKQSCIDANVTRYTNYRKNYIDGKRRSYGSVFVNLKPLYKKYKFRLFFKKLIYGVCKLFVRNTDRLKRINVFLTFLFLGATKLTKHCDSVNRFCWDKNTKESDFINYLNTMQQLADNKLTLEVEIKGN